MQKFISTVRRPHIALCKFYALMLDVFCIVFVSVVCVSIAYESIVSNAMILGSV